MDPLEKNGFRFYSTTNILSVDSPLLMMHAEDDPVIPHRLGEEVRIQNQTRNRRHLKYRCDINSALYRVFQMLKIKLKWEKEDVIQNNSLFEVIQLLMSIKLF